MKLGIHDEHKVTKRKNPFMLLDKRIYLVGTILSALSMLFFTGMRVKNQWDILDTGILDKGNSFIWIILSTLALMFFWAVYNSQHFSYEQNMIELVSNTILLALTLSMLSFASSLFVSPTESDLVDSRVAILGENYENVTPAKDKRDRELTDVFKAERNGKHYILYLEKKNKDLFIADRKKISPTAEYIPEKIN